MPTSYLSTSNLILTPNKSQTRKFLEDCLGISIDPLTFDPVASIANHLDIDFPMYEIAPRPCMDNYRAPPLILALSPHILTGSSSPGQIRQRAYATQRYCHRGELDLYTSRHDPLLVTNGKDSCAGNKLEPYNIDVPHLFFRFAFKGVEMQFIFADSYNKVRLVHQAQHTT